MGSIWMEYVQGVDQVNLYCSIALEANPFYIGTDVHYTSAANPNYESRSDSYDTRLKITSPIACPTLQGVARTAMTRMTAAGSPSRTMGSPTGTSAWATA